MATTLGRSFDFDTPSIRRETREKVARALAAALHDRWQGERDVTSDPKREITTDTEWISSNPGPSNSAYDAVDVGQWRFADLPVDLQSDRIREALQIVEHVAAGVQWLPDRSTPVSDVVNDVAAKAHLEWAERNERWLGRDLKASWKDLPADEKERFTTAVIAAWELLVDHGAFRETSRRAERGEGLGF